MTHVPRTLRCALPLAFVGLTGAAQAQMCAPFTDVAASDAFCSNIQWMHNRAITLGCTATAYCPALFVRRDQMAAFMNRLGNITFQQGGNAFGTQAVLGTSDGNIVDIVAGARVMRYHPSRFSPNLIGGHPVNDVAPDVRGATIAGGGVSPSDPDPDFAFVMNGSNRATSAYATVSGGQNNRAGDVSGDAVSGAFATVGGGVGNRAGRLNSMVGGGDGNTADGSSSTVGGGFHNSAAGNGSTIAGGSTNTAAGHASTVPGGEANAASGNYSFAAGRRAKATATGAFMWADSNDVDFGVNEVNFFAVRATGGVGFTVAIDGNGGGTQFCDLRPGIAGWQCVSDRDAKENFERAQGDAILAKLAAMPLYSWNFKGADPAIRNLGPTAQDFRAAFGLGAGDRSIAEGNLHGVALAAIQGLNAKLESEVAEQRRLLRAQAREIADLRDTLAGLLAGATSSR